MASKVFHVKEHVLPSSHIREYPLATAETQEHILQIAIKQYIPKDNPNPRPGDITIIGAHANGFPKELYEPLWTELHSRLKASNLRIRSIWIADVAWQGQSGVLNEKALGNDPSWMDHSRDLLLMVNHFRAQMPRPLIGIGHSMGGCQLVNLSLMHPRLLTSLVLIDPVIAAAASAGNWVPARASAKRRDIWPSRAAAAASFAKSPFYQSWDRRVLDLWLTHGLRNLPTHIYPFVATLTTAPPVTADAASAIPVPSSETEIPVTLTTTKHQEVLSFMRANYITRSNPTPWATPSRTTHADVSVCAQQVGSPFYRHEPISTFAQLPHLRPSVLYVFGETSNLSAPEARAEKMAVTGVGHGGSGGRSEGRVKEVMLKTGHLVAMERPEETARECADWIGTEMQRFVMEEQRVESERKAIARADRGKMTERYEKTMLGDWVKNIGKGGGSSSSKL